jgi:NADPH-dependent glutamate synthase beta subunit-like oxidoreductase
MPDTKTSALAAITADDIVDGDLLDWVDVSDTTMAASGTNKRSTRAQGAIALARWKSIEVDFGSSGVSSKTFAITDAEVLSTFNVIAMPSGKTATDRVGNDFEWDAVQCTTRSGSGTFDLTVMVLTGHIRGKRTIVYQISK